MVRSSESSKAGSTGAHYADTKAASVFFFRKIMGMCHHFVCYCSNYFKIFHLQDVSSLS